MTDIAGERSRLAGRGLAMVTREQWGAVQSYTSPRGVDMPARGFVLHISVTQDPNDLAGSENVSMRTIERIGQERFGIGFPYNAAAFDTGRLYEGQPLTRRGAHTVNERGTPGFPRDMNWAWRALCLPQMVGDTVTDAQIDAAARWAAAQIRSGLAVSGATWSGHRDYAFKSCPGDRGYARIGDLNRLTRHYAQVGLGSPPTTPPAPEPKDSTMKIVDCSGRPAMFVGGPDDIQRIDATQRAALRAIDVETHLVDIPTSDAIWSLTTDDYNPGAFVDQIVEGVKAAFVGSDNVDQATVEAGVRAVLGGLDQPSS